MNQGVYSLSATMVNQLNRVNTLSNNLANVNTTGFKQDNLVEGSFNYYMDRYNVKNIQTTKLNRITNTVPKIDGHYVSSKEGTIVATANALDFSIKTRDAFFKIKNSNGEIVLSKDGSFKNLKGFLVNSDGNNVLNANNEKIAIEEGFENQIALLKSEYSNLDKIGNNNYKIKDIKNTSKILDNEEFLLQGSIEKSNVNTISTMVALIDSQRRLEQAQKATSGINEINQKLIDKLTR